MTEENKSDNTSSLSVNDLKNLLTIVDVASKRGAFTPKEFGAIGEVYGKVDAFLTAATGKVGETDAAVTNTEMSEE